MGTGMETLVVGNCVLDKAQQNPALAEDYTSRFERD
jgi:carbamoyltransferase